MVPDIIPMLWWSYVKYLHNLEYDFVSAIREQSPSEWGGRRESMYTQFYLIAAHRIYSINDFTKNTLFCW